MQVRKSPHIFMFIWKQYPDNFALLILRILELFVCKVCKFLKNVGYSMFYCFWTFVNKLFTYHICAYVKSRRCFIVKSSKYYFHMKTNILADFEICISVPLKTKNKIDLLLFYGEHSYGFWESNFEKRQKNISQQTYIYIYRS